MGHHLQVELVTGRLEGRVAVVTGGAQGIGAVHAELLAAAGAAVAIVDIASEAAAETARRLADAGATVLAATADVADAEQVASAHARVIDELGPVDVLVNNAGGAMFPTKPFDEVEPDEWDRIVAVNLRGAWLWSRATAPWMRRRSTGRIVNIASTVVDRGYPIGLAAYAAAKAGIIGLTRMMARELGPYGVTVNAVAPGYTPVATPKTVHSPEAADRLLERMLDEQCLKRAGTPRDMARTVAFLASDDAAFITGQVISVDGGWTHR